VYPLAEISGQTHDGRTITIAITSHDEPDHQPSRAPSPEPSAARLVVGATVHPDDFDQLHPGGTLDGAEWCRTYSAPGEMILPWSSGRRLLPAHVAEFHSFQDWPSDRAVVASLTRMLDQMPAGLLEGEALLPGLRPVDPDGYGAGVDYDGFSMLLSYWWAGEREFLLAGGNPKEWRRRHDVVYRTIRQHPNGRRVGYMPVQTCMFTESTSSTGNPQGDFDPLAWWAGVGDFAGYTAHMVTVATQPTAAVQHRAARSVLAVAQRLANGSGRPLFVAELGLATNGAEPVQELGLARAAWIRALVDELHASGAAGVGWLDAAGANGWDYRLVDEPSLAAWQDAMYGRNQA
jgi:hypothetical protein